MDKLVEELHKLTSRQYEQLASATHEDLESFVERREEIIAHIREFFNSNPALDRSPYKQRIDEILALDVLIMSRMEALHSETMQQIQKTSNAKKQASAYEPYGYSSDGVFFDSKR